MDTAAIDKAYTKQIEQLKTKLQNSERKKLIAQAQFYDVLYAKFPTSDIELKARIVYLEQELKNVIRQRDELKKKTA